LAAELHVEKIVVDASAVLAWLLNERGGDTINKILDLAVAPVSVIVEVLHRVEEKGLKTPPAQILQDLESVGVSIEPILPIDSLRAAELIAISHKNQNRKEHSSLSLGDGLLVTGGDKYWNECDLRVEFYLFR
jgi:PIN domain nuclease of toxin-antitoxin system